MSANLVGAWMVGKIAGTASLAGLEGRVFPDVAPKGTKNPCLVYQLLEDEFAEVLDAGPVKDGTVAFQMRIYAGSRMAANELRDGFRKGFQNLEGFPLVDGDGRRWWLDGTSFSEVADTFEEETGDYGGVGVLAVHLSC